MVSVPEKAIPKEWLDMNHQNSVPSPQIPTVLKSCFRTSEMARWGLHCNCITVQLPLLPLLLTPRIPPNKCCVCSPAPQGLYPRNPGSDIIIKHISARHLALISITLLRAKVSYIACTFFSHSSFIKYLGTLGKNDLLKWITNKVLLYSTGNSAQCYVAAWMGGGFWGEHAVCCA